jgi:hypothetical protein
MYVLLHFQLKEHQHVCDKSEKSLGDLMTGANQTTLRYNASAVKIYNATSSLMRFEKNIFEN